MDNKWQGSHVALITPFDNKGEIDYRAYNSLLEFHLNNNTNGIVVCGTTGEASALSPDEYAKLISFTVSKIDKKIPVIAGTGTNSTSTTIANSILAESLGVDAVLVVSPYYNKPTSRGMYMHFESVANSIDIPVILYNVPGRTSARMDIDLIINLASNINNIMGIKEASGDLEHMARIISAKPNNFKVFSGDDALAFQAVCMGADGVISVVANIIPAEFSLLMELTAQHKLDEAREIYYKYLPLMDACFIESNPIPVKTALHYMHKTEEIFRLPLCVMNDDNKFIINKELKKLSLI